MSSGSKSTPPAKHGGVMTVFKIIKNNSLSPYFLVAGGLVATAILFVTGKTFIRPMLRRKRIREAEEFAAILSAPESRQEVEQYGDLSLIHI